MQVLKEPDGKPSFSRWLPAILTAVSLFVVLHAYLTTTSIDASVVDLMKWVYPWSVAPYAVNKFKK